MTQEPSAFTTEEAKYGPGFDGKMITLEKRTSHYDENGHLMFTATTIPVHTCVVCGAPARQTRDGSWHRWECIAGHIENTTNPPRAWTDEFKPVPFDQEAYPPLALND